MTLQVRDLLDIALGAAMKTKEPSKDPVRITDHAVLRYMQRAMGLNVEIVREHIASLCAGPAAFGATAVRAEGVRFEIVNGAVVTVVEDYGPNISNTTKARNQRIIDRRKERENLHFK